MQPLEIKYKTRPLLYILWSCALQLSQMISRGICNFNQVHVCFVSTNKIKCTMNQTFTFTFTYIFCCVLIEEPLVVGITNACYILQDMSFLLAVFWRLKNEIVILLSRKQGVKILPFLRLRFDMPDITYVLFLGIQGHRTERDYTLKFCCFFLWTDRRSLHRAASVVDVQ